MSENIVTAAFWILVGLSFLGTFAVLEYGIKSGPNGGAVGAWLLFIPILLLLGACVVFEATSMEALRIVCLMAAGITFLAVAGGASTVLVVGPLQARKDAAERARARTGVNIFPEPAQVAFLKAVEDHDVEKVKALLPAVGDLNKLYHGTTLFTFVVEREETWSRKEDLAILEAMLKAGANPNVPEGTALLAVHKKGPAAVKLMLEAGADVNYDGYSRAPLWWQWLYRDHDVECVKLALAHGANVHVRKDGLGAVHEAVYGASWEVVVMLIEAGAPIKGEGGKEDVAKLYQFAKESLDSDVDEGTGIRPGLMKAVELLAAATIS